MSYEMNTLIEAYKMRLDIQNVRRIFSIGRPASSSEETEWVNTYLFTPAMQKMGMYKDGFAFRGETGEGNCIIEVGEGSRTLFSSHTDTVHRTGGPQNVMIDLEDSKLITDSGQCLGSDDGTGIWLMWELIKAGVPGLYIFHRAEEVGGQGSSYIANNHPELLEKYDRAIAFDRKDDWSIITHQGGSRCCSDAFGRDLAQKLNMGHRLDTGGSFTDTANYDGIIPECTNLSVGYHNAHSGRENQEIPYLLDFRDALINIDWENLVTERDPTIPDYSYGGSWGYSSGYVSSPPVKSPTKSELTTQETLEDYKKWDKGIDHKTTDVDDWTDEEIWDGSWDYLFEVNILDMSEIEYQVFERLQGDPTDDGLSEESGGLDDSESSQSFWDDDDQLPRTAQDFMDWTDPTEGEELKYCEHGNLLTLGCHICYKEEKETIPDVESQEMDWDSWFEG